MTSGWRRTEARGGREWNVQPVSEAQAVKSYVCPACGLDVPPGVAHLVAPEVVRGRLAVLPVEGTPVDLLWHVTTLGADRRSPMATRLRRFLDTPDAMQAIHRADGSVPVSRFRPPVYVTLWS